MQPNILCRVFVLLISLNISSCSYTPSIMLFNNSDGPIELCNLAHDRTECATVRAGFAGPVWFLRGGKYFDSRFTVAKDGETNLYETSLKSPYDLVSKSFCRNLIIEECFIALQLQNDGLIFWAGRDSFPPIKDFPDQPDGFPARPAA